MSQSRASKLGAVSAVAAASFAAVTWASASRATAHFDRTLAPRLALRPRTRRRKLAEQLAPIGKWYSIVPAAVVAGAVVARVAERPAAGATIIASATSALLAKVFDHLLPQPPVPANHRHEPQKAVFPSGHAMVGTAVSLTTAYVVSRERLASGAAAFPAAIVFSLGNPALKLAVRKHWPTDAIGGLAAGLAVAAACCAVYEAVRD
jgi:membrane-associated phospholipid phosphatase